MRTAAALTAAVAVLACCRPPLPAVRAACLRTDKDLQAQARASGVVLKALAMRVWPGSDGLVAGHFAVITVYKGARYVKDVLRIGGTDLYNIHDKRMNVTGFWNGFAGDEPRRRGACGARLTVGTYYVLFADVAHGRLVAKNRRGALVEWTDGNERAVWRGLGWSDWSDWSACNVSCDTGLQYRHRRCLKCGQGHNKEMRKCNDFPCDGAMELIAPGDRVRTVGGKLNGSQNGFSLLGPVGFPKTFSLLITLKVEPKVDFGTVFRLSSSTEPLKTVTLEVSGPDLLRVSVNTEQSNRSVLIATVLADGITHQLGLGFQEDEIIAYLDCRWVTTETLMQNSYASSPEYDSTDDFDETLTADLVQMIVVPDPAAVSDQCTVFRIAVLDTEIVKTKIRDKSQRDTNGITNGEHETKRTVSKHSVSEFD
ncbi:Concanavalin A-like lectin/glucanase domain,Thrombospondin type-1 (TSP1) repeat [Cinara cedri]|uniref:Concanavalin A-like lectin/glucanase domain,Thrombospondin type-1 (TSP1) repeat n=1 Tax=Cinara cedri TaxID=506608 RepID=A0A5E4MXF8_9HEMI|nr:Concanavalin A-like lectin/glucanase domain,Thrombospondin type-1 (TSP1) repeat [Cinara cedri]